MAKRRANGEGSIYPQTKDKNGKPTLWAAQYTDNTGTKRTLYGKTQQLVKGKLKEAIKQSDNGLSMGKDKITFAEWLVEWLEVYSKPVIKKATYASYYNFVMNHTVPAFPSVLLKDLRANMLQKFFNEKAKNGRVDTTKDHETGLLTESNGGLKVSSLEKLHIVIVMALKQAVVNKILLYNVAQDVKLPKKILTERRILSLGEQRKVEELALKNEHPLGFCIFLALYTGLRIGELLGLKITDVSFSKKTISVNRTVNRVTIPGTGKSEFIVGDTKTTKGNRVIPIPDFLLDMIENYISKTEKIRNLLKYDIGECPPEKEKWLKENFLFSSMWGKPYDQSALRGLFNKILEEADIEHVTFHALRHSFATRCIEQGFDIKSLSDILGHTDAKMTLNTYTHALEEQKRSNMDRLMGLYGDNLPKTPDNETAVKIAVIRGGKVIKLS